MTGYFTKAVWLLAVLSMGSILANFARDLRAHNSKALFIESALLVIVIAGIWFSSRSIQANVHGTAVRGEVTILLLLFCVVLAGAVRIVISPLP